MIKEWVVPLLTMLAIAFCGWILHFEVWKNEIRQISKAITKCEAELPRHLECEVVILAKPKGQNPSDSVTAGVKGE